ncbi:DUF308 domain-containing protein [Candidatus Saccharibacteria bacterium]|nr:DUF308 domain-containing protein [Candidatus Saccharibacteria bacterium]
MAHINRKYIDSHWLIFVIKGLVAIGFGAFAIFDMKRDFASLVTTAGIFLLSLSIIEFINALYRARSKTGWGVSVSLAVADAVVALALLFTISQSTIWHLYIISGYTFIRGFAEIIAGFRATVDPTDRFTWVFSGICGAIMGIVILNSREYFVRFFGVYLLIIGICALFYGVHNRAQKQEDRIARQETAALAAKTRRKNASKSRRSVKKSKK